MAGSLYGRNVYGRGLYSAVRNRDLSGLAQTAVGASALLTPVKIMSGSVPLNVSASASMITLRYVDLVGKDFVNLEAIAGFTKVAVLSGRIDLSVQLQSESYIGPYWQINSDPPTEWATNPDPSTIWTDVVSTPDPWSGLNG